MRIVFFGTSNVALPVLEELKRQHEIVAVVTTPDSVVGRKQELSESPVSALAKDLQLVTFKPESLKNNPEFLAELQKLNADIFVIVSYGKILPLEIINIPKFKAVNVHFSLLPKYRGSSPIQFALLSGDNETGTSLFLLDEKVDDGPILTQEVVKIERSDNFFTLSDKLSKISANLINSTLQSYTSGNIVPLPQNEALASYTKIITKADGKIIWKKTSQEIYNQFRAFFLWPGIWAVWNGNVLKVTDCSPIDYPIAPNTAPGSVLDQGVVVCGNNTALQISRLQLAGKNEVGILEFLNGYRDFVGSKLE